MDAALVSVVDGADALKERHVPMIPVPVDRDELK
jgi:desulfoferrodoxin (superoxide reductase-like protein)